MAGDERNRLSGGQRYKLMRWVEDNLLRFATENVNSFAAAAQAAEALGFSVTQRNIISIAGNSKEAIFPHTWAGNLNAGGGPEGGHANRRLAVVVAVLDKLLEAHSGAEEPLLEPGLNELWEELKAQCAVPGGTETDPEEVGEKPTEEPTQD